MKAKGKKKKSAIQELRQNTDQEQTTSEPAETANTEPKDQGYGRKLIHLELTDLSLHSFQGTSNFTDHRRLEAYTPQDCELQARRQSSADSKGNH